MQRVNVALGYMRPHIAQYVTAIAKREKNMKMAMEMVKKKGCSKKEIEKKRAKTSKNNKIHKFEVFIGQKGEGEKGRKRERAEGTFTHPKVLAGPCLVL